jgi:hypothetical protein
MADDPDPPRPEPKQYGNSAGYLRARLKRDGLHELLGAIDRGELSVFAASVEVGYRKRPVLGSGSDNESKRRYWVIQKAFRQGERADAVRAHGGDRRSEKARLDQIRNTNLKRGQPIDLVAALAEVAEMQRPRLTFPITPPSAVPEPTPPERFPAHAAISCATCTHPCAVAAMKEILDTYTAARRGGPVAGSLLPRSCCQRQLRCIDPRALIG